MAAAGNPELYKDAAEEFQSISLFRDSSERAAECMKKLYSESPALIVNGAKYTAAEANYYYGRDYLNLLNT